MQLTPSPQAALTEFLAVLRRQNKSHYTTTKYAQCINAFLRATELTDLSAWQDTHVNTYLDARHDLSPHALHTHIIVIRMFAHWCLRHKLLTSDPFLDVQPPRFNDIPIYTLSIDQLNQLLDYTPDVTNQYTYMRHRCAWHLMALAGLRISEVVNLKLADITATELRIAPSKNGATRTVPLVPRCKRAIDDLLPTLRWFLRRAPLPHDWLFPSNDPANHMNKMTISTFFTHVARKLNYVNITAHSLRHTYATLILQHGANTPHIQKLLGHKHLNTTQRYLHLSTTDIQAAANLHPLAQ